MQLGDEFFFGFFVFFFFEFTRSGNPPPRTLPHALEEFAELVLRKRFIAREIDAMSTYLAVSVHIDYQDLVIYLRGVLYGSHGNFGIQVSLFTQVAGNGIPRGIHQVLVDDFTGIFGELFAHVLGLCLAEPLDINPGEAGTFHYMNVEENRITLYRIGIKLHVIK